MELTPANQGRARGNILKTRLSVVLLSSILAEVISISLIGNKLEISKSVGEKTRPRDFYFYILVYMTGTGFGSFPLQTSYTVASILKMALNFRVRI